MLSLSNYLMLPSTVMLRCSDPAANWIADNLETGHVVSQSSMGSSDWASTYVYQTDKGASYFVKVALGGRDDSMFKGEALGLQAMYGKPGCLLDRLVIACSHIQHRAHTGLFPVIALSLYVMMRI